MKEDYFSLSQISRPQRFNIKEDIGMKRTLSTYGLALLTATTVMACSATQQVAVKKSDLNCGFLGSDCNRLAAGAEGQAALRYANPNANWTQYPKIVIDPVTFWGSNTTKVSAADQQALTDYFYQVLHEELGKKFQIVDQAGPGVMKLQMALTDAEGATPGLRTVSMIVPQARSAEHAEVCGDGHLLVHRRCTGRGEDHGCGARTAPGRSGGPTGGRWVGGGCRAVEVGGCRERDEGLGDTDGRSSVLLDLGHSKALVSGVR